MNETITLRVVNRKGWPGGPWDAEPDDIRWRTGAGLPAIMLRHPTSGHWCGYVGVAPTHPTHGVTYWDPPTNTLEVHGGVTYNDRCDPGLGVCHVPAEGEADDFWWHGFDLHHGSDFAPGYFMRIAKVRHLGERIPDDEIPTNYKDVAYVRSECESLATQLKAMK